MTQFTDRHSNLVITPIQHKEILITPKHNNELSLLVIEAYFRKLTQLLNIIYIPLNVKIKDYDHTD